MTTEKLKNDPCRGAVAPRRSTHISSDMAQSDGEVWQEKLAVCEGVTPCGEPKLLIRSFYRNKRTGERFWDEPPSGAGSVLHATAEMRKKAELQKEELQLTLEMIPPEEGSKDEFPVRTKDCTKNSGFLGRFRKKGSKTKKEVEISKDLNLQRAIARSIADQSHGTFDEPIVHYNGENDEMLKSSVDVFDEELALAKALSISESANDVISGSKTEEEMFQHALEQSQRYAQYSGAVGVAALPTHLEEESFISVSVPAQPYFVGKRDPNESVASLPSEPKDNIYDYSIPKTMKLDP